MHDPVNHTSNTCDLTGEPWATTDTGTGHPWPVLSGENGEYQVLADNTAAAVPDLQFMLSSASGLGLVPEEVWDYPDVPASPYGSDPATALERLRRRAARRLGRAAHLGSVTVAPVGPGHGHQPLGQPAGHRGRPLPRSPAFGGATDSDGVHPHSEPSPPPICSYDPALVPYVIDTIPPSDVNVQDELNPLLGPVVLDGVGPAEPLSRHAGGGGETGTEGQAPR
ncbi:MAG: hypothetical protein ACRDZX_14360 [Acidimicrobiales bacterium]